VRLLASRPTPKLEDHGISLRLASTPLTCPAWVTLPVATLPPP
jgi:hypothetical protein